MPEHIMRPMRAAGFAAAALAAVLAVAACQPGGPVGRGPEHRYAYRLLHHDRAEMACLNALWRRESNWNPDAVNPSSGAAGIPQDITGNMHGGWRGQIRWGIRYIRGRYGDACSAWAHEQAEGWY